jgi:hypothetical protein
LARLTRTGGCGSAGPRLRCAREAYHMHLASLANGGHCTC